jgi:hypothetical protein
MSTDDPATEARNTVLQIVTAARGGGKQDMILAATLTREYADSHGGSIEPLFVSAIGFIETILLSVAEGMSISPDKLLSGICLGVSINDISDN